MISPASTELHARNHLRTFYILTITQVLSLIGSAMSHVAIGGQASPATLERPVRKT
jgi:hypothetical protein